MQRYLVLVIAPISIMISILIALSTAHAGQAVIVDRIVATVDSDVITYSDLKIERTFNMTNAPEREVLQELIDRRLLLIEAKKFKITETEEESQKTQQRFNEIKDILGKEKFSENLKEYNLTEPDIIKMLKEKYLAEKFVSFRINFFVIIPDNSIKAYYTEHKNDFMDTKLESVYEEIKSRLFQSESRKRLQEYMVQIRKKAKITINNSVKQ
ncbi:MAG: hypothetical protein HZA08_03425 [Nitrospirae bacterium]|nr:hypothetical protein [Nitrospirota bacterium]